MRIPARALFGCWFGCALVVIASLAGCSQSASNGPSASPVVAAAPPPPPPLPEPAAPPAAKQPALANEAVADNETDKSETDKSETDKSETDKSQTTEGQPAEDTTSDSPGKESQASDSPEAPSPADLTDSALGDAGAGGEGEDDGRRAKVRQVAAQAGGNAGGQNHPFPKRIEVPEFSQNLTWLNTRPLTIKKDLKGKFVLLDFWTYCCINCMHILPELKKLEHEFPNNLVVIGVHSAKFETEKMTGNIRDAILRYEIEHPVINDADHSLWEAYGVSSWPTIVLIDPEGNFVGSNAGEFKANGVSAIITNALPYYRQQKLLDEKPLTFQLEAAKEPATPLRFPGKILADEAGGRMFISDSNHNRIVIATLAGKLIATIGSGEMGKEDGDFPSATFNHPQGCALHGDILYVADTENHLLRKVDLQNKTVTTIAGTGEQASNPWPGWDGGPVPKKPQRWVGPPTTTALNSPWALWVHETDLFIAMAGCHQIWKMPLDESEIGPHAGNGREDIVDGAMLPVAPFRAGSSFAQPSGLSSDGHWLFVADSEGSSVRAVPFVHGRDVKTIVGSDNLPQGQRLFASGDRDGPRSQAKLQHCLEVDYLDGKIYVADTYNHKIKVVNARNGETKTFAGTGKPGSSDSPAQFHEPAGLAHVKGKLLVADTNNHLIRTVDLASGKVTTLTIEGLAAPEKP